MNNPFQYQNDLSQLNSQFDDIHQYYQNKMAAAKSSSLLKKGQDLAKQSQDLAAAGRKTSAAVEEIVGAAAAKKLVSGVVKPGVQNLIKGGKNVVNAVRSRFGGGGEDNEAEGGADEGAEDVANEGFEEVRPGVFRANRVARPNEELNEDGGADEGIEMQEGVNQGGDGIEGDEAADDAVADAADDAAGDAAGDVAGDAAADAGADAAGDIAGDVAGDVAADAGADAVAGAAGAVAGADWWNPVGWFAGLVAAGAGIASAVEAANDSSAGDKMGKAAANQKPNYSPPPSFAGRYVVPVNNALTAF